MDGCLARWRSSRSEVGSYLLRSHLPSVSSSNLTVLFLLCTVSRCYPYLIAWIELVWFPAGLTSCTDSLFLWLRLCVISWLISFALRFYFVALALFARSCHCILSCHEYYFTLNTMPWCFWIYSESWVSSLLPEEPSLSSSCRRWATAATSVHRWLECLCYDLCCDLLIWMMYLCSYSC